MRNLFSKIRERKSELIRGCSSVFSSPFAKNTNRLVDTKTSTGGWTGCLQPIYGSALTAVCSEFIGVERNGVGLKRAVEVTVDVFRVQCLSAFVVDGKLDSAYKWLRHASVLVHVLNLNVL